MIERKKNVGFFLALKSEWREVKRVQMREETVPVHDKLAKYPSTVFSFLNLVYI